MAGTARDGATRALSLCWAGRFCELFSKRDFKFELKMGVRKMNKWKEKNFKTNFFEKRERKKIILHVSLGGVFKGDFSIFYNILMACMAFNI